MEAFLAQYDQQRALAEADDAVVLVAHPDLDVDQTLEPSQAASQPAALSEASLVLLNDAACHEPHVRAGQGRLLEFSG